VDPKLRNLPIGSQHITTKRQRQEALFRHFPSCPNLHSLNTFSNSFFGLRTSHFLFAGLKTLSAPIRASPSTTLERVNTAFGQMVSAAFWSRA